MSITEESLMNVLIPNECHIDMSLYEPHKVGSGIKAYTFYTGPNFIVTLSKDLEKVRKYLSRKGVRGLDDIEVHGGVTLIELGWEDDDTFEKIKDNENTKKRYK